jgi:hypothetical protein
MAWHAAYMSCECGANQTCAECITEIAALTRLLVGELDTISPRV